MNIRRKNDNQRNNNTNTPKATNKPNIEFFIQDIKHKHKEQVRIHKTPNKIRQRVQNSPLKIPLERAIKNVVNVCDIGSQRANYLQRSKSIQKQQGLSVSKIKGRFSNRERPTRRMHKQTYKFIDKYFEGYGQQIPKETFVRGILQQYDSLWQNHNVEDDIQTKIQQMFGYRSVKMSQLIRETEEDGMIGLILRIFKEIKDNQNKLSIQSIVANTDTEQVKNLKNVIQQFMESMYQCLQNQIYAKFNVEMRRMIVKYRETERLLKKINEKLTTYADVFDIQKKVKNKERAYRQEINKVTKQKQKLQLLLDKQSNRNSLYIKENDALKQENGKLKDKLDRFQHILLTKALDLDKFDKYSSTKSNSIIFSDSFNSSGHDVQSIKPFVLTAENCLKRERSKQDKENIPRVANGNLNSYGSQKI